MKLAFDIEFMRHAMLVVAGHRFWMLPFATLPWLAFQYYITMNDPTKIIGPGSVQGTLIGVPLTALGMFFGMRIIAGEIDDRSLEIAYTVPGGCERLWFAKLFSAFLMLVFTEAMLSILVYFFFTPFPPGALYGALQASCFYMILAMALGALFRSETSGLIGTAALLGLNGLLTGFGDSQMRFLPFFNPYVYLDTSSSSNVVDGGFTSPEELLAWAIQNRIAMLLLMGAILSLAFMRSNRRETMLDGM